MNTREILSAMDEAMLVRGLKGKLRQSKSCENLVALGLFDDISLELTQEGKKVARLIVKEQKEKSKEGPKQKVYTELVLGDDVVGGDLIHDDMFEEDVFEEDIGDDLGGLPSFSP